ncbi:MAG: hypothetical protein DLM72_05730 [Candidatus Nitrosopolaris wilkensis]|nr:MAG: hypothetical protein DLM72_05730 [Candidatus Nitrosopolaris wilkensis]
MTFAILIIAVSLSIAIEIGFVPSLQQCYAITADSYNHSLYEGKILDLSQKGARWVALVTVFMNVCI